MPPRTCPLAAFAAVLAFSAFFLLSAAAFLSLPSLMAAWRAALRASGRWVLLSLITSSEAPTMARWCLTVRRVRFFATSCRRDHVSPRNIPHLVDVVQDSKQRKITGNLRKPNEFDDRGGRLYEPRRYPSYAFFGRASSMLFCEDSCVEGKVTRFCHSGNGRSCCRLERRACPEYWRNCQHIRRLADDIEVCLDEMRCKVWDLRTLPG